MCIKQKQSSILFSSAIAITAVLVTTAAHAQDAGSEDRVEDIVVTAQKREQSLQDVPMSISAISADTLRDSGTTGIAGIAAQVPSLALVQSIGPRAQSYLGSDPSIPTFEPSVALFIDGVYMPRTGLGVDGLVDIARVEVLKGPQSTLHGKNATAGVISVISSRPSDKFAGSLEETLSRIEGGRNAWSYRLAGSITGPISDKVRARLTGVWYDAGRPSRTLPLARKMPTR